MGGIGAGFEGCHEVHDAAVLVTPRGGSTNELHLTSMNLTARRADSRRFVVWFLPFGGRGSLRRLESSNAPRLAA
jgi:hypothetical protein